MNSLSCSIISQNLAGVLLNKTKQQFYDPKNKLFKKYDYTAGFYPKVSQTKLSYSGITHTPLSNDVGYNGFINVLEHVPYNFAMAHGIIIDSLQQLMAPTLTESTLLGDAKFVLDNRISVFYETLLREKRNIEIDAYEEHLLFLQSIRKSIVNEKFNLVLYADNDIEHEIMVEIDKDIKEIHYRIKITPKEGAKGTLLHPRDERQAITKIKTELTVEQIGILTKLLIDSGLFFNQNESKTKIQELVTIILSSKNSPSISLNKLERIMKPGYTLDSSQTKPVLQSIIDKIQAGLKKI